MPLIRSRQNAAPLTPVPVGRRGWLAAALVVCLAGCGSDGGGTALPPEPTGTIALNLTPSSLTIARGGSGSVAVGITRGGSFDGPVTLSASGVPAGVSVTFGSTTISALAGSTSVNLTVAAGVATGTTDISIVGAGAGGVVSPAGKLTLRIQ